MNTLKLVCLATVFASGIAQAAAPCNGFELKVKNQLADDLLVTKIVLDGAELNPGGIQRVKANSEQVFTVNNSQDAIGMKGNLVFHTISLPSKDVKIQFDLKNAGLICEHNDTSPEGDFAVEKTRLPGKVHYTITNK